MPLAETHIPTSIQESISDLNDQLIAVEPGLCIWGNMGTTIANLEIACCIVNRLPWTWLYLDISRTRHLQIPAFLHRFPFFLFPVDRLNPQLTLLLNKAAVVVAENFAKHLVNHSGFHLGAV